MEVLTLLNYNGPIQIPNLESLPVDITYPGICYVNGIYYETIAISEGVWEWRSMGALAVEQIEGLIADSLATLLPGLNAADVTKLKNIDTTIDDKIEDALGGIVTTSTGLETPRRFGVSGGATGSVVSDLTSDVIIPVVVGNDSHTHSNYQEKSLPANAANKLTAPITINITGDVTGTVVTDFSTTVNLTASVVDNSHDHSAYLSKTDNLAALTNKVTARSNLGLGTAAILSTGVAAGNIPVRDAAGKVPGDITGAAASALMALAANVLTVKNDFAAPFDSANRAPKDYYSAGVCVVNVRGSTTDPSSGWPHHYARVLNIPTTHPDQDGGALQLMTSIGMGTGNDVGPLYYRVGDIDSGWSAWRSVLDTALGDSRYLAIGGVSVNTALVHGRTIAYGGDPDTVTLRDGAGDISARLFRSLFPISEEAVNEIAYRVDANVNNYTRHCSAAHFRSQVITPFYLTKANGGTIAGGSLRVNDNVPIYLGNGDNYFYKSSNGPNIDMVSHSDGGGWNMHTKKGVATGWNFQHYYDHTDIYVNTSIRLQINDNGISVTGNNNVSGNLNVSGGSTIANGLRISNGNLFFGGGNNRIESGAGNTHFISSVPNACIALGATNASNVMNWFLLGYPDTVQTFVNGALITNVVASGFQVAGSVTASGNVTAYSDERLKFNIQTIQNALDKISYLNGVSFNRVEDGKAGIGVTAQNVQNVFPELVHEDMDGKLSVAYGNLVGPLIEAVKELSEKVTTLETKLAVLEANRKG